MNTKNKNGQLSTSPKTTDAARQFPVVLDDVERTLTTAKEQVAETTAQVKAVLQHHTEVMTEMWQNTPPAIEGKDFRLEVDNELNIIDRVNTDTGAPELYQIV